MTFPLEGSPPAWAAWIETLRAPDLQRSGGVAARVGGVD